MCSANTATNSSFLLFSVGRDCILKSAKWVGISILTVASVMLPVPSTTAQELPERIAGVPGQPLAANVARVLKTLEYLGAAWPEEITAEIQQAVRQEDAARIQDLLDPHVLLAVSLNPEYRVKVQRGPATASLQQGGYVPLLVKVHNQSTVQRRLRIFSPQSGPVYAGAAENILARQAQTELNDNTDRERAAGRFLELEMYSAQPMTSHLSGLEVEYALALLYASVSGRREATIGFDVGTGSQDLGFRGEVPVLFDIAPAIPVRFSIRDEHGLPTAARLEIRDADGRVYPPQAKRLAPDFFFQPQIYRADGQTVLLPPGDFSLLASRGPEYVPIEQRIHVAGQADSPVEVRLRRWIDPLQRGYVSGDHHIHAAGCSHYDHPTQGVTPQDMFWQVKGEGLNVGCVLTWGPCFDYQRQFFSPEAVQISEPHTLLKYDLEISGFGSAALGHVCLLNLKDQTYPGSEGTMQQGWPTWTVPVMRWAKEQGAVTGYPHSAIHVDAQLAAERLVQLHDRNADGQVNRDEARSALLPAAWESLDQDGDNLLSRQELTAASDAAADQLPNLALPAMSGAGAMEIFVSVPEGVCDFISAMDTARISEWNTWYHLLNCGFPLKLSGETDFPCMSSRQVGQGRVYVRLDSVDTIDFDQWCAGLAAGRSYVSDGYAHAFDFQLRQGSRVARLGEGPLELDAPGEVEVTVDVALAAELPEAVAYGTQSPAAGPRMVGDTVQLHGPRSLRRVTRASSRMELVCNGRVVAQADVPADGRVHTVHFTTSVAESSWLAVRQFPQLHTNPIEVRLAGAPIRASRSSALWCAAATELLWDNRHRFIVESERAAAEAAYRRAASVYRQIASEAGGP